MATLLNGINDVLKKTGIIQGSSGELSSLTDTGKQPYIDAAILAWNEVVDEMFATAGKPMPNILAEATITLATNDRDYALASDFIQIYFPLVNKTTGLRIQEYPGGYLQLFQDQLVPNNYTGTPQFGTIRPTDGQLYLDRIPTATENGDVYKYRYEKDSVLDEAADTMPFNDKVYRALVPAVAEIWSEKQKRTMNGDIFSASFSRACRYLSGMAPRTSWSPRRVDIPNPNFMAPFDG